MPVFSHPPNGVFRRGPFQSTAQFADDVGVLPQTVRKRYSQTGSYFGILPIKLPNGKLRWPVDGWSKLVEAIHR